MEKIEEKFNPLVSIVIPVYNGSNYMREAIDSALSQTYKNIEVIVVNDGSTDSTEEIAHSYGDRIRYFSKENGGVSTALNLAIKNAKGEYISWLSHDDVYYPEKIEKQVDKLSELNGLEQRNTILMSNYSLIDERSVVFSTQQFHKVHGLDKLNYPLYPLLKGIVHGCTLMIPRHCFDDVGYFDERLKVTQDYDLWFRMFPNYGIIFISDVLVKSRWHAEQGSKKIVTVSRETDELWIQMIDSLTNEQKIIIGDSVLSFYQKTLNLVKNAGYSFAERHLLKLIDDLKRRDLSEIKVSVIVPFFNRIEWTVEAIESILAQSHKNLEIILINDFSFEDIEPIKSLVLLDDRVKLFDNIRKKGASGARNTGIDIATGEYVAFLDSDDLFCKEKIHKQIEFMVRNGVLVSHTSYELFGGEVSNDNVRHSGKDVYTFPDIIAGCAIATPTVMVSRQVLFNARFRFPERYSIGEDVCFWIALAKENDIVGVDDVLTMVRRHQNNAAFDSKKQIIGLKNMIDFVVDNFLSSETIRQIKKLNDTLLNSVIGYAVDMGVDINSESLITCKRKIDFKAKKDVVLFFLKYKRLIPKKILLVIRKIFCGYSINYRIVTTFLKKILISISPSFRMLVGNKERVECILENVENVRILLEDKYVEFLREEERRKFLNQSINTYENIFGQPVQFHFNKDSTTSRYKCSNEEFFEKMKKFILKTDVVLDIGCGVRPQNFFVPRVHICIEPFKQYREIIKPFLPNDTHFIFLRKDALISLRSLDDASVDTVFLMDVIEHLEKVDGKKLLEEVDRVSRKQIIVFTPYGFYPMHFRKEGEKDAWGLSGTDVQEHRSGWFPEDFGDNWDFHVCVGCHDAFFEEEKKQGKKYDALMAIKTKRFEGFPVVENTPGFVKEEYKKRFVK